MDLGGDDVGEQQQQQPQTSAPTTPLPSSSFFSGGAYNLHKLFKPSSSPVGDLNPDPDEETTVWYSPDEFSAVITRKEHPRDPTSLLSIREVLRHKTPDAGILSSSRFATSSSSRGSAAPPSAWAKADVGVSKHVAPGEVLQPDEAKDEGVEKVLVEIEGGGGENLLHSRSPSSSTPTSVSSSRWMSNFGDRREETTASSVDSDATVGADPLLLAPDNAVAVEGGGSGSGAVTPTEEKARSASAFNSLTTGLSNAMRFVLTNAPELRPHSLLSISSTTTNNKISSRPHIKYDWTIGKRLKFSCTVYYAKQFDLLRKRCQVDDHGFLNSLAKSANWAAQGGKSKSNFWKTEDERFIIKTLLNAWNVADLYVPLFLSLATHLLTFGMKRQSLIDLAPSYFQYLDSTATKATLLAKLIGFYTVEIRNLESGSVQAKADLLVMENLFYDQRIDKTFDLKGIQGRKVKAAGTPSRTLFDGEWIEGTFVDSTFQAGYESLRSTTYVDSGQTSFEAGT